MAGSPDSGLEGRIAALEGTVRSLMATNWTDRASVVDASGAAVPLSGLAFGQVQSIKPGVRAIRMTGTNGAAATLPSGTGSWLDSDLPLVDVLVRGGRLRVDWAANMSCQAIQGQLVYSYSVTNLGNGAAPDLTRDVPANRVVAPDFYRALLVFDPNQNAGIVGHGSWAFHTGLTPGWHRVRAAYQFSYAATAGTLPPDSNVDNPRIGATPF